MTLAIDAANVIGPRPTGADTATPALLPACVKSVLYSPIWTSLIVAVFAPLSVRRYKRVGDKK